MIHVVTVHWETDKWIDIQLQHFKAHIAEPFRVYAYLTRIDPSHKAKYFHGVDGDLASHAVKLNMLAEVAVAQSESDDDWLMFFDGDAFPIGDLVTYGAQQLQAHPLIAVQRRENNGDIQPHPCFCLTTIGFWRSVQGDWCKGYEWRDLRGQTVTDVGGNLLGILQEKNIAWHPLRRSNKRDLDPVLFGIYDDIIYHHGAGFRAAMSRIRSQEIRRSLPRSRWTGLWLFVIRVLERCPGIRSVGGRLRAKQESDQENQFRTAKRAVKRRMKELSDQIYQDILADSRFYTRFQ